MLDWRKDDIVIYVPYHIQRHASGPCGEDLALKDILEKSLETGKISSVTDTGVFVNYRISDRTIFDIREREVLIPSGKQVYKQTPQKTNFDSLVNVSFHRRNKLTILEKKEIIMYNILRGIHTGCSFEFYVDFDAIVDICSIIHPIDGLINEDHEEYEEGVDKVVINMYHGLLVKRLDDIYLVP